MDTRPPPRDSDRGGSRTQTRTKTAADNASHRSLPEENIAVEAEERYEQRQHRHHAAEEHPTYSRRRQHDLKREEECHPERAMADTSTTDGQPSPPTGVAVLHGERRRRQQQQYEQRPSTAADREEEEEEEVLGEEGGTAGMQKVTSSQTIRRARARLGLQPVAPINEDEQIAERHRLWWSRVRVALREPLAEFLGMVIMVLLGSSSSAQVLLSKGQQTAPGGNGYGPYQNINWGWGIGTMLGLYVAGDSGAYLNPAVTLANCIFRQLPWRRFPTYAMAQFLGALVGTGIVYANYINAIDQYEGYRIRTVPPNPTATASIFCTFPQPFLTKASQFVSEFIASAILVIVVFAFRDPRNNGIEKFPLMMFFLWFGLGAGFGWNTGYSLNPARDLGARVMATLLGYGSEIWTAGDYYFIIQETAPFCGCVFGGLLYDLFIYTGISPVNTPWMGLKHILRPDYAFGVAKARRYKDVEEGDT